MFDKLKAAMELQKKMQEVKRQLDAETFETASPDGMVRITMNGAQEVREVVLSKLAMAADKGDLEKKLKDVYNRAIRHSHELAASKMKNAVGESLC